MNSWKRSLYSKTAETSLGPRSARPGARYLVAGLLRRMRDIVTVEGENKIDSGNEVREFAYLLNGLAEPL